MSDRQLRVVRTLARQSLVVLLAAAVSGCGSTIPLFVKKPPAPATLQEGVTVSTSVVYVRPWAEVAAALSPKFANTPEAALGNVLNSQSFSDFRLLQSLGFSLQGGVKLDPISAVTDEAVRKVATKTTGDTTETTSDTTDRTVTTKKVDDNSPPAAGDLPASRSGSATGLPDQIGAARAPGTEPFFRYSTAAALYQEIGLLNDAVAGLPGFEGKKPYVIRLRVGVVPVKRDLPWDVYAHLALMEDVSDRRDALMVLPILSSEAYEGTMDAAALQQINEIRLGLQALAANAKIAGGFSRLNDNFTEFLTRTYSPALQVTGTGGTSIDVKFAASKDKTGYALMSRNFYVTVVAYLDEPALNSVAKKYRFHLRYEARDAEHGSLVISDSKAYSQKANETINNLQIKFPDGCRGSDILWTYIETANIAGLSQVKDELSKTYNKECVNDDVIRRLMKNDFYIKMVSVRQMVEFNSFPFEIQPKNANLLQGAVPLVQNGRESLIVDVPYEGPDQLPLEKLSARLTDKAGLLSLLPRSLTLRSAGSQRMVRIEFPALSAFKAPTKPVAKGAAAPVDPRSQPEGWIVSLAVRDPTSTSYSADLGKGYIAADQDKPVIPEFAFSAPIRSARLGSDGMLALSVYVKPPESGRVKLTVKDAEIIENDAPVHELTIATAGTRALKLRNATPGQAVTLTASASLDADAKAKAESSLSIFVQSPLAKK